MQPCSQFYWRSLPLANRTGSDIFDVLFQRRSPADSDCSRYSELAALLESPYPLPSNSLPQQAIAMARYSICAGKPRQVEDRTQLWTPKIGSILPLFAQMERLRYEVTPAILVDGGSLDEDLPFTGGWLGWLGYDFAWEVERLPWLKADSLPFPVALWYEPAEFAVLDHFEQRLWLAAESLDKLTQMTAKVAVDSSCQCSVSTVSNWGVSDRMVSDRTVSDRTVSKKASKDASRKISEKVLEQASWNAQSLQFETEQADFEQAVRIAKAYIRSGDVFQVNHSLRFSAQTDASSWEIYRTLQQINPSPFASYWRSPWGDIASCSPERLVHLRSGKVQSRPIAGTRPRGATLAEDLKIADELRSDIKERAEHIMLVDLERNDLGRVCEWGSVAVDELMTIERYSHVMHLVSNVTGQLHDSVSELVASMFPGGTITGCPKVRCMEIIEEIEPVRRSLFYGSCGYIDRRGRMDLNILIRTLLLSSDISADKTNPAVGDSRSRRVWGQVGAGIVADSQPEREWVESLHKAKAQLLALGLRPNAAR